MEILINIFLLLLAWIGVIVWLFMYVVHLIAIYCAKTNMFKRRTICQENISETTGVSIIKPLSSTNENIMNNLETLFQLDYPLYEILICLQYENNEIISMIHELMDRYPNVDCQLFAGASELGVNPKINNMLQAYPHAKYSHIWICDSNICASRYSLTELASHIAPDVALVHQLPYIDCDASVAGCLEKTYFGTQHARWYLAIDCLGFCCANGMSWLVNKNLLEEVGGLLAFSDYIAEDFFISMALFDKGYRVVLSTEPAIQTPKEYSISMFINRMARWTKLRLNMIPSAKFEPFTECYLIGAVGALSLYHIYGYSVVQVFLVHVSIWFVLDQVLLTILEQSYSRLPALWKRLVAWLIRESITYIVMFQAILVRSVSWRAGKYTLTASGRAEVVQEKQQ